MRGTGTSRFSNGELASSNLAGRFLRGHPSGTVGVFLRGQTVSLIEQYDRLAELQFRLVAE